MANLADLNVSIGADLAPLEAALSEGKSLFVEFGKDVEEGANLAAESLKELYQQLDNLQAAQAKLPAGSANYQELGIAIDQLNAKINKLEGTNLQLVGSIEADAVATRNAAAATRELTAAEQASIQMGLQVDALDKKLTADALAKAAAENTAADASGEGAKEGNKLTQTLGALGKGFSFVKQAAYLIPGIGIGGIFEKITDGIEKATEATGLFGGETKEAALTVEQLRDKMNGYAQAIKQANDATASQIAKVSELVAVLDSETIPLDKKTKALKELQTINDQYFGDLRIENGLVTGLSTAYQNYADNIFKVAKAKGAEAQIQNLSKLLIDATGEINNVNEKLTTLSTKNSFGNLPKARADFKELSEILKNDFLTLEQIQRVTQLTGLSDRDIAGLIGQRVQARTQELRTLGQISELSKIVAANDSKSVTGGTGTKDKVDKIDEALKKLQADLVAIQTIGTLNKTPLIKIEQDQLKAMEETLRRLIELGLTTESVPIKKLTLQIQELQFEIDPNGLRKTDQLAKLLPKNPKEFLTDPNADLNRQLDIAAALTKQHEEQQLANKKKNQKKDEEDVRQHLAKEAKMYEALGGEIKSVFEGIFTDLVTNGKLSFESLAQSMAKLLINLAATAAEAAVLSLILSSITGGANIAGSIGASGTGFLSLFKALIPHAEGGVFTGPTVIGNHLFGEAGPEFVVGQDKLEGLLSKHGGGNGFSDGQIISRIDGNDLVLVFNRQGKYNKRNYGNFTR